MGRRRLLPSRERRRRRRRAVMATTQRNANAAVVLLFLYRMVEVLTSYFKEVEEESIRDNFVITYELMDEMMDFGYPQISEAKILREYITQEAHRLEAQKLPMAVTNAVSWRSEGIKHRKNEIFLDVRDAARARTRPAWRPHRRVCTLPLAGLPGGLVGGAGGGEAQPPGERQRNGAPVRDPGGPADALVLVGHARAQARAQ